MSLSSVCFLLVLSFIFLREVSAHLPGQPAFFKVNGMYTNHYKDLHRMIAILIIGGLFAVKRKQ